MEAGSAALHDTTQARRFDVICAGETVWKLAVAHGSAAPPHLAPSGGAVNVARALVREGVRVGLATVLADDSFGRATLEQVAASGVDVGGVAIARPRPTLVVVDSLGEASDVPSAADEGLSLEVPAGWSSNVLVLSGLSPVVSRAAALCREARRARRAGTLVLIDFNAGLHAWSGRDPRTIRMVLREVDVARASFADLAVLGMDLETVRASLRPGAVLVVCDGSGGSVATGPFGEVAFVSRDAMAPTASGRGDAFTAGVCVELIRPGEPGESASAAWHRALQRGHAAQQAHSRDGM